MKEELVGLAVTVVALGAIGFGVEYLLRDSRTPAHVCRTVSEVGPCVHNSHFSTTSCRVQLEHGVRINTNRLVMQGDQYCYLEPTK